MNVEQIIQMKSSSNNCVSPGGAGLKIEGTDSPDGYVSIGMASTLITYLFLQVSGMKTSKKTVESMVKRGVATTFTLRVLKFYVYSYV